MAGINELTLQRKEVRITPAIYSMNLTTYMLTVKFWIMDNFRFTLSNGFFSMSGIITVLLPNLLPSIGTKNKKVHRLANLYNPFIKYSYASELAYSSTGKQLHTRLRSPYALSTRLTLGQNLVSFT